MIDEWIVGQFGWKSLCFRFSGGTKKAKKCSGRITDAKAFSKYKSRSNVPGHMYEAIVCSV
jgi:hypothetical protein